jgi:SAM-dependent methyltransferase
LEIGSGIGNITRKVIEDANLLVGIEPNAHCANVLRDSLENDTRFHLVERMVEECNSIDMIKYNFDTILCVNILEHVKDDTNLVSQFKEWLIPNGRVLILVPAIQLAYGPIDASVGHFRRYNKNKMINLIRTAGFNLERIYYSNLFGLLGWIFNARVRKSIKQSDSQIKFFDSFVPVISKIEKRIPPPLGLSLIAIAKREK